ncbi:High-affinity glucose transporter ght2 [Fulvia fulva]|uniref:High-affinity glucose transporter ght2 n=1 Tax=Passalora fulva TaxID=5499 RepID=A0A9Q8P4X1_PASFU|nr:High-affinity glucose transporter ght2 [Fulvia fulva]KAK4632057.1 High-affinity glucose transporter ght2 [Fulvia fulva]KAK4633012.1 High-affinity glucose transporter ght2 [Fulvia fulva]UJO13304.1 High-affinity glucose transporter ght2 [Fulvia fulva]WPV11771.1 High-affinity glucose transporter ght2 [Fulvia fulva]WPV25518.1 High-affinity glucose transporter ght2 [Fulvia fulva]
MPFLKRTEREAQHANQLEKTASPEPVGGKVTFMAVYLGLVASIGGFIFGYVSGQISGFFEMANYGRRFGHVQNDGTIVFSAARQGTITGLLCIGCLFGALISGKMADVIGRKLSISASAFFCCVGTVIEISSETAWYQFAIGRLVNGLGIGALSVLVPMYQSESSPARIRGVLVSSYQLFITLGIWTAEMVCYGTHNMASTASWRIPNGLSFLWALILGAGILFLPESPRYAYRVGREDEARTTIARLGGLAPDSREVNILVNDIRVKLDEEHAGGVANWHEFLTGPRMFYRVVLGIVLQAGQQLTGANFFFYYGTTIFKATGLNDSYVTQIILGTVNVACTFGGLYVVQKCGRRNALMVGAAWMFMCFMVYSFVGHFALDQNNPQATPAPGNVLIVFSCLFIAAFATTWGPIVWAVVGEMYPSRYRAPCMALATASNWLWNFLMSFFTRFITDAIDYLYGLVFAGCCLALVIIVFFFVIESKDRSLEEIDTMYVLKVNPITSAKWDGSQVPKEPDSGFTSGRNSSDAERAAGAPVERVPTKTLEE